MESTVERKYALTRLSKGDYLLPSNDGQRLWRIYAYTDGPSFGLEDWPRDRRVWAAAAYVDPWTSRFRPPGAFDPEHLDEPSQWADSATTLDTRQEAIDYALRT